LLEEGVGKEGRAEGVRASYKGGHSGGRKSQRMKRTGRMGSEWKAKTTEKRMSSVPEEDK
jgi:hypothetical protein